jgi:hypothetical protein
MSTKIVQVKPLTLSSNIGTSNTTAIVSGMIGLDGADLVQADFGSIIYGTFEPNTDREEAVSFTITSNTGGVAEIDFGVSGRGLIGKSPYGTGGIPWAHSSGVKLVISNNPNLFNKFTAKDNDETVSGSWQFPTTPTNGNNPATKTWTEAAIALVTAAISALDATLVKLTGNQTIAGIKTFSSSPVIPAPTSDLQAATKKYADDLAIAGAPDAGETTKGLVEEATDAQVLAGTATGETGAKLFITPAKLQTYLGTKAKVRAYKSDAASGIGTSPSQIAFGTENYDVGGNFASNAFTAPRAGYYHVTVNAHAVSTSSSTARSITLLIYKNGSAYSKNSAAKPGDNIDFGVCLSDTLLLAANDVITAYVDGPAAGADANLQAGESNTFIAINEL